MKKWKAQETYAEKMERQNCLKISTWVPDYLRQELLDIAEEMRRENLAELRKRRKNNKVDD